MRRRQFLRTGLLAGAAVPAAGLLGEVTSAEAALASRQLFPDPRRGLRGASSLALDLLARSEGLPIAASPAPTPPRRLPLADTFPDLPRHFVFEYYPWYGVAPWRHWTQWDRLPPDDVASNHYPRLGPYDSLSTTVLEQHARWIADSGVGAINLSWWGPGSYEDRATHRVMDVMGAHGLKVAFHLEPYADDRGHRFRDDCLYLVREYGERRRFDAFLLLANADGKSGPVFKGFRCLLPREVTDCHGLRQPVPDFTADSTWREQIEGLRATLRTDFDHTTILADAPDFNRLPASGFDGCGVYDNFVMPVHYRPMAEAASRADLLFSFNVNPGFDSITPRRLERGACYTPPPFEPPVSPPFDWAMESERERAAAVAEERIRESLRQTLAVQTDPALGNLRRGFFLVYITSFNEWHEGHGFEPMQDAPQLTPDQRALGYHNPASGDYRLSLLAQLLRPVLEPPAIEPGPPPFPLV